MVNSVGFNSELIQIADTVAREKGVSRNLIIEALEQAIQSASKKKYGHENIISAKINQNTGDISINREIHVVEEVENPHAEISLEDAAKKKDDVELGDVILEPLPPLYLGSS